MTTVQLADADIFITTAAIVVNKLEATTGRPPGSPTSIRGKFGLAVLRRVPCVSSIGRSKCQSSNTTLEDWY
jgi:hypothetical protein